MSQAPTLHLILGLYESRKGITERQKVVPTSHCFRQMSMFLRCAFEKWSHTFCLVAAAIMLMICSTLELARGEGRMEEEGKGEKELGNGEYEAESMRSRGRE